MHKYHNFSRNYWLLGVFFLLLVTLGLAAYQSASAESAENVKQLTVVIDKGYLRVRLEPSLGSEEISKLYNGDLIEVNSTSEQPICTSNGFVYLDNIPNEYGCGYVYVECLADEVLEQPVSAQTNAGSVRVRKYPTIASTAVKKLKKGTTVTVESYITLAGEQWAYIGTGYIMTSYLDY